MKREKCAIVDAAFDERGPMTVAEAMHATGIDSSQIYQYVRPPKFVIVGRRSVPHGGRRGARVWRKRSIIRRIDPQPTENVVCWGLWSNREEEGHSWQYQTRISEDGLHFHETHQFNVAGEGRVLLREGIFYWEESE